MYDRIVLEYLHKMKQYYDYYNLEDLKLLKIRSEASDSLYKQTAFFLVIISFFLSIVTMIINRLFQENKFDKMQLMLNVGIGTICVIVITIMASHYNVIQRKLIIDDLINEKEKKFEQEKVDKGEK